MYIILEAANTFSLPKNVKQYGESVRLEVVLQTANDINVNRRRYSKDILDESIKNSILPRISNGGLLGELDHPITSDNNTARQVVVWYKDSSHKFLEIGWDGNKLVGVIETLAATPNGQILRDLVVKDKIPVGFSYRGMGELKQISENGKMIFDVQGPLLSITWDSVSNPSHTQARLIRISENNGYAELKTNAISNLSEEQSLSEGIKYSEKNGMICTNNGVCYLPDAFDMLVQKRVIDLKNKFKI